ncbi:hypothetical protein ACOMHN_058059 [Nucella lapillus]
MTSMSSALTTQETNRLHRWAMWRMTVNEGIISCIRENGTTRVIYPDSSSDSNSLTSEVPDFHEFPFITPEQMSLARKLNLREKYGSNHGLSDDAYFIFGLPRINIDKDIPEVTSTGTQSVYESFSELGDAVNASSQRMAAADNNGTLNMTYSELGPTPDAQSLASHNDMEVQKINGYREPEGWKHPQPPVPRLNLYSIQEELNNNTTDMTTRYSSNRFQDAEPTNRFSSNHDRDAEPTNRFSSNHYQDAEPTNLYSSNRYQDAETTNLYSSNRYQDAEPTNRFSSNRDRDAEPTNRFSLNRYQDRDNANPYLSRRYQETTETTNSHPSFRYADGETANPRYLTNRYQAEDTNDLSSRYLERGRADHSAASNHFQQRDRACLSGPNRYQQDPMPKYSVKEVINRYESVSRDNSTSDPVYYGRQTSNRSSTDRFNRNIRSPPHSPRHDVYPPFAHSRQNSFSPTPKRSYSPLPSSPRQNHSPLPTSSMSYNDSADYGRQNSADYGRGNSADYGRGNSADYGRGNSADYGRQNCSPPMSPVRKSSFPTSAGSRQGSPGYTSKMRPTRLMSDGETERLKRQAYYDWSTPTTDRYMLDFGSPHRYS